MRKPLNNIGVCLYYLLRSFRLSSKYRIKLKNYLRYLLDKRTIIVMTLLVKDEEKLIEKNIRFHYAMGVNCFVVTVHNSTDNTLYYLLKLIKEGIPIEIIVANDKYQLQDKRVHKMIKLAKSKFKADWVINADADEFYYSKDFNLKKSILKYNVGNVIKLNSTFSFPNGNTDRLLSPYFITTYVPDFWYKLYTNLPVKGRFIGKCSCVKVIHKAKGYKHIFPGNHDVRMQNKKVFTTDDIILYHFTDGNYVDFEEKVKRYLNSFSESEVEIGEHIRSMINLYKEGKLKEYYDSLYSSDVLSVLTEAGIVTKDYSLINYMKYKEILR